LLIFKTVLHQPLKKSSVLLLSRLLCFVFCEGGNQSGIIPFFVEHITIDIGLLINLKNTHHKAIKRTPQKSPHLIFLKVIYDFFDLLKVNVTNGNMYFLQPSKS
jgi:hypothetical protein